MIFKLNKKLYNIEAVKEAIKDFGDVCKCRIINDKEDKMGIEMIPKENDVHIKEEFCNYVLGLMKNKSLI